MNRLILIILLFFTFIVNNFAQSYSIEGYVKSNDNSILIGAAIFDKTSGIGTITNEQGYFHLNLDNGKHVLLISYVGYKAFVDSFKIVTDLKRVYKLKLSSLDEVVIKGTKQKIHFNSIQKPMEMDMVTIKSIPSIIGEPDIMKALALLPGIGLTSEISSNLTVRGANHGQNLIVLDEAPLYQSGHLFGFISPFNYSAIKDVKVYKNAIPSMYGGKLSSVIELHSNNGNPDSTSWEYSYGLLNAGFSVSTPIIKDKLTFFTSARTFYLGIITLPWYVLYKQHKTKNFFTYYLYDINTNIKYTPNGREELALYIYSGLDNILANEYTKKDDYGVLKKGSLKWGNNTVSLKYKRKLNNSSFFKSHLTLSESFNRGYYGYFDDKNIEENHDKDRVSSLQNLNFKSYIEKYKGIHYLRYGIETGIYRITPFEDTRTGTTMSHIYDKYNYGQVDFFIDDLIEKGKWSFYSGLRYSNYFAQKEYKWQLEPRLSFNYHIDDSKSIGIGYQHLAQYSFLLPVSNLGLPNDMWVSVLDSMKPSLIDQVFIEYNMDLFDKRLSLETNVYVRKYSSLYEIKNKSSFITTSPIDWNKKLSRDGKGYAYGFEMQAGFSYKKNKAILSYTYSRNKYYFNELNRGNWFSGAYDLPHQLDINVAGKLSKRWTYSILFTFKSGKPLTLPNEVLKNTIFGDVLVYGDKNGNRLSPYHRLDLSASKKWVSKKGKIKTLTFSLFNAYYHKNPFFYEYVTEKRVNKKLVQIPPVLKEVTILPIVPSVSYSVKF